MGVSVTYGQQPATATRISHMHPQRKASTSLFHWHCHSLGTPECTPNLSEFPEAQVIESALHRSAPLTVPPTRVAAVALLDPPLMPVAIQSSCPRYSLQPLSRRTGKH